MTLLEIISAGRRRFEAVEVHYMHPLLYMAVVDKCFSGISPDIREFLFLEGIDGAADEIERLRSLVGLTIILLPPEERPGALAFLASASTPHWLSVLGVGSKKSIRSDEVSHPLPIHFINIFKYLLCILVKTGSPFCQFVWDKLLK